MVFSVSLDIGFIIPNNIADKPITKPKNKSNFFFTTNYAPNINKYLDHEA